MTEVPGARMRAEIAEQPDLWRRLAREQVAIDEAAGLLTARGVTQVVLAGRGTSDHAALYGQYLLQVRLAVPAYLATPSVATVYGQDTHRPTTAVVALSQSGRSPDMVETLVSARRGGAPTVAITNDPDSPLAAVADVHVPILAGPELAVAATKSYTAELLALYLLVARLAGEPPTLVSEQVEQVASAAEGSAPGGLRDARHVAGQLRDAGRVVVIGRGYALATAREAALKLTETCSLSASGWSAADAKHGPLAQVSPGTPVFCLLGAGAGRDSVTALLPDLRVRGARVWTVRADDSGAGRPEAAGPDGADDEVLTIPGGIADPLVPLLEILPFQRLALELALSRGLDPDRPPGLSKVTLTR